MTRSQILMRLFGDWGYVLGIAAAAMALGRSPAWAQEPPTEVVPVPAPNQFEPSPFGANLVEVDTMIRATAARTQFNVTGRGLCVAVLDTGLRTTHQDFAGTPPRVLAQVNNTSDNGGDPNNATDGQGHGSNVCGIVAANGGPTGSTGIAPGANIVPIKVLNNSGGGTFQAIEKGIDWVLDHREEFNITVVNMSLGDGGNYPKDDPFASNTLRQKIQQLRELDVAVVIAAGNDFHKHQSKQGMGFPGIFRESVSVGAVYDADIGGPIQYQSGATAYSTGPNRITPFSQRLHDPMAAGGLTLGTDILAPGAAVKSTGFTSDTAFSIAQHGTSQAAPAIAGVILLMQEYHRNLTRTSEGDPGVLPSVDDLERWIRRGSVPAFDGDDENDNVVNTNETFLRIDAVLALDAITQQFRNELTQPGIAGISGIERVMTQRGKQ